MLEEWREYRKEWRIVAAALALAAAVALALWLGGGFAAVAAKPLPRVTSGARVVCNNWFLTPLRASVLTTSPDGTEAASGSAWLVLEAETENRTHTTRVDIDSAFHWQDPQHADAGNGGVDAERTVLLRDATPGADLHPGMPERIALLWKIPVEQRVNGVQTWRLFGRQWVARDRINGGGNWLNQNAVAEVQFDVRDPRGTSVAQP